MNAVLKLSQEARQAVAEPKAVPVAKDQKTEWVPLRPPIGPMQTRR
jgi:hypothetical protein